MVEMRGIAPLSDKHTSLLSTSVVNGLWRLQRSADQPCSPGCTVVKYAAQQLHLAHRAWSMTPVYPLKQRIGSGSRPI